MPEIPEAIMKNISESVLGRAAVRALVEQAVTEWVATGLTVQWVREQIRAVVKDIIARDVEQFVRSVIVDVAGDVVARALRQVFEARFGITSGNEQP